MTDKIDKHVQVKGDQSSMMDSFKSSTDNFIVRDKDALHFPPHDSLRTTT